jgi:hypothetical protein
MQDLVKNKLFLIVAAFMVVNVLAFFGSKIIIDRAADKVIEKLQKEYSPSPYGPGVDPDRLHPTAAEAAEAQPTAQMVDARSYLETRQKVGGYQEEIQFAPTLQDITQDATSWRNGWESERGFSSVQ